MLRGKKIAVLSHCLLNVNSKVKGLASYSGALQDLISYLMEQGYGIYQLPCAEMRSHGINRWGQTLSQYDNPFYERHCRELAHEAVLELLDYQRNGYEIPVMIGQDGSPNCGVEFTWKGDWGGLDHNKEGALLPGEGVFVRCLREEIEANGIRMTFWGLDEQDPQSSIQKLIQFMEKL